MNKDDCILYEGRVAADGYGQMYSKLIRRNTTAHRAVWMKEYGYIPPDVDVMHLCDVLYEPGDTTYRACINLEHLVLGDDYDNQRHSVEAGRAADHKGEAHYMHKLTDEEVLAIRTIYVPYDRKRGARALAKLYKVHRTTIERILRRELWTHL